MKKSKAVIFALWLVTIGGISEKSLNQNFEQIKYPLPVLLDWTNIGGYSYSGYHGNNNSHSTNQSFSTEVVSGNYISTKVTNNTFSSPTEWPQKEITYIQIEFPKPTTIRSIGYEWSNSNKNAMIWTAVKCLSVKNNQWEELFRKSCQHSHQYNKLLPNGERWSTEKIENLSKKVNAIRFYFWANGKLNPGTVLVDNINILGDILSKKDFSNKVKKNEIKEINRGLSSGKYKKVKPLLERLVNQTEASDQAKIELAKAYVITGETEKVNVLLNGLEGREVKSLLTIALNQQKMKNSSEDSRNLQLLTDLETMPELNSFCKNVIENLPSLEYRKSYIPVIKKALEILNPEQKEVKITVERKNNLNYVDLSNNPKMSNISPIRKIYNHSINLSNTAVTNLSLLGFKMKLFHLNLSHTPFKNISQINNNYPGLGEMTISKRQFSNQQLSKLSKKIRVIYK